MPITVIILSLAVTLLVAALIWVSIRLYQTKIELAKAHMYQAGESHMEERFRSLANETLTGHTQQFLQLAKASLEGENLSARSELEKQKLEINHIVDPLKKKLDEYQQHLLVIEKDRQRSYSTVENELKRVAELSATLNVETSALKNALKKPNIRGRWGEVQLKNCIEIAGMSEFCDVTFQDSTTMSDGTRFIPDMIVRMPGDRMVIVDAKTPLDAFLTSLEANDDETRLSELSRHGRHVKDHIKKLSLKEYQLNLKNSADFTVLFLPNESFLYAALETEPDLMEFAIQKKILIATPPTLIGLLKVVRFGWNEEKLAENAQKISEVGTELHKRLVDFVDAFVGIGRHLEKAKEEYDSGLSRLQSRVITQAKRLEQLGAKSSKELDTSVFIE